MRRAEVAIPAGPPEETDFVDARVSPTGSLENLSQQEVDRLLDSSRGGLYQLYRAWTADVERHMQFDDARTRRRIVALARFGLAARGIVLGVVGWFLVEAARHYDPSAAGGTDEALRALGNDLLLGIVALGLVAYGLYQIAEARYRRIG